jgi:hypothetical protein
MRLLRLLLQSLPRDTWRESVRVHAESISRAAGSWGAVHILAPPSRESATALAVALLCSSCAIPVNDEASAAQRIAAGVKHRQTEPSAWVTRNSKIVEIAKGIPKDATSRAVAGSLRDFFEELERVRKGELALVYDAIGVLRTKNQISGALALLYAEMPKEDRARRLSIVKVAGELRDPQLLGFLVDVATSPLPEAKHGRGEKLTPREREELIQSAATRGIAFIRDPAGKLYRDALSANVQIMREHPSRNVRIAAIDAYMWNSGDSPAAAARLYNTLPSELHKYVDRPRFHRGANAEEFAVRLAAWQQRWEGK